MLNHIKLNSPKITVETRPPRCVVGYFKVPKKKLITFLLGLVGKLGFTKTSVKSPMVLNGSEMDS